MTWAHDTIHPEALRAFGGQFYPWKWDADNRDGEHFRRCSWCGSVNPEDLAAEKEWRAEWADRKYGWPHKFYVNIPNRDTERVYVIGMAYGSDNRSVEGENWIKRDDLTDEQWAIIDRDGARRPTAKEDPRFQGALLGTRSHHHAKFYTIHLADSAVPETAREAIHRRSGLVFRFDDHGGVTWEPYRYEQAPL